MGTRDVRLPPVVWPEEKRTSFLEVMLSHACLGPLLCSWIGRGHTNTRVAPALPAQVPGPVSDHHRPQALRLCRPGIHFSQLHHHRPGAAPDRGWQHCEWLGPSGKARDRQRGRPPGPAVGQGAGLRRLGEISKAGIREVGETGNLPLRRGTSPWAAKWQPPLGAPWRKAEVSRWLGSSGSPRPMVLPGFFRNASSSLCPTTSSQPSSWAR